MKKPCFWKNNSAYKNTIYIHYILLSIIFAAPVAQAAPFTPLDFGSTLENNPFNDIGWVPRSLIPSDIVDKLVPAVCEGVYFPVFKKQGVQNQITITSDKVIRESEGRLILQGDVEGMTENIHFRSNKAIYNKKIQQIEFYDRVVVYINDAVASGSYLWLNLITGEMRLDGAQFIQGISRTRLQTKLIERDTKGVYYSYNVNYTTCEPHRNDWRVYGKKLRLDYVKGWGEIQHAVLYIQNVPIFYFPWFTFPLDSRRKTGVLIPTISTNEKNGFVYTQPLYLNLAPNYDMFVHTSYLTKRGTLLQTKNRLLTSFGTNTIDFGYIRDNKIKKKREYHILYHQGGTNLPIRTLVDYGNYSDPAMYKDFNFTFSSNSADLINQKAEIGVNIGALRASVGVYNYQPLASYTDSVYARKPGAVLSFTKRFGFFGFDLETKYDNFHALRFSDGLDKAIGAVNEINGVRDYAKLRTGMYISKEYGSLEGFIQKRYHAYALRGNNNYPKNVTKTADTSVVKGNIIFDRRTSFFAIPYSQTLELTTQMVSTPFVNQNTIPNFSTSEPRFTYSSIFATDRFRGEDKFGDTKHISYAMITRLFNANDIEFFRFQIGQIQYFQNRETTLYRNDTTIQQSRRYTRDRSPIAGRTVVSLVNNLQLTSDVVYDQKINRTLLHTLNLRKTITNRSFLHGGYNFIANDLHNKNAINFAETEQASVSGIVQLTAPIAAFGRIFYDIKKNEFIERMNGIEYESCCWKVVVGAYHRTDFDEIGTPVDTGYFLLFHLKGLMSEAISSGDFDIGNISDALEKSIPGINTRKAYTSY